MKIKLLSAMLLVGALTACAQTPMPPPGMTLTSPAFEDGAIIPSKFTQSVASPISPKLDWTNVPAGTVSFTLLFIDLDVARNKTTEDNLHWMVLNLPGTLRSLPENVAAGATLPDGSVQPMIMNSVNGYRGPGMGAQGPYHHYTFQLYALDTKLDLGPTATRVDVLKAMDGHVLTKAVYSGRFHK